jgi:hypothetical protein
MAPLRCQKLAKIDTFINSGNVKIIHGLERMRTVIAMEHNYDELHLASFND